MNSNEYSQANKMRKCKYIVQILVFMMVIISAFYVYVRFSYMADIKMFQAVTPWKHVSDDVTIQLGLNNTCELFHIPFLFRKQKCGAPFTPVLTIEVPHLENATSAIIDSAMLQFNETNKIILIDESSLPLGFSQATRSRHSRATGVIRTDFYRIQYQFNSQIIDFHHGDVCSLSVTITLLPENKQIKVQQKFIGEYIQAHGSIFAAYADI